MKDEVARGCRAVAGCGGAAVVELKLVVACEMCRLKISNALSVIVLTHPKKLRTQMGFFAFFMMMIVAQGDNHSR